MTHLGTRKGAYRRRRLEPIADVTAAQDARTATGQGWRGRSKYRAVPVVWEGQRFASKAEFRRYQELLLLGMAGEIRNLELQPRFPLKVDGVQTAVYVGDFRYSEFVTTCPDIPDGYWLDVVEDVKGMKTPVYRLKAKHFQAQYPHITFREV